MNISSVTKNQLLESKDYKWVGQYVKAVTLAPAQDVSQHVTNIDEYFRKNFRKINARQALDVLEPLGEDTTQKAACLDGAFWPWETLEEAIKGNLN